MEGTLTLFGYPSTDARLEVLPRSKAWRGTQAVIFLGGGLLLAPAVGLVPPHAPWVLGVLGLGVFLGRRKWMERFTLLSLTGICPKCEAEISITKKAPLRPGMAVPCPACRHDSRLMVVGPAGEGPSS